MTVSNKLIELLSARAEATAILSMKERQLALLEFRRRYIKLHKHMPENDKATLVSALRKLEFILGGRAPAIGGIKNDKDRPDKNAGHQ